jgi:phage tail-like protein
MSDDIAASSYLGMLPAVLQRNDFLGRFLLAFERILSAGPPDGPPAPALEQVIDQIDRYFRPVDVDPDRQTPEAFLPWLAGWVSLSLREDWDEATKRRFLREIVPLYRKRGTKAGLHRMLQIYLGDDVPITIYDDCRAGEFAFDPPAHFFQVQVTIKDRTPEVLQRKQQVAMAIIDQEKPAHTYYAVQFLMPTMRLLSEEKQAEIGGELLLLGRNTLLGTQSTQDLLDGGTS